MRAVRWGKRPNLIYERRQTPQVCLDTGELRIIEKKKTVECVVLMRNEITSYIEGHGNTRRHSRASPYLPLGNSIGLPLGQVALRRPRDATSASASVCDTRLFNAH